MITSPHTACLTLDKSNIHTAKTGSHKTHNPYTNPQTQDLIGLDFTQST
jgi:hypothetical protein